MAAFASLILDKLRVGITIVVIVIYLALFNFYLYQLIDPLIPLITNRLLYNYMSVGMLLFLVFDWKAGFQNYTHKQLNYGGFWVVIIHYGMVIANYHGVYDPLTLFIAFDTGVILAGIILVFCTWKH